MKNPFRFWMTGGVAIMVAAVSGGRCFASEERLTRARVSRLSVSEAMHRIEACAQRHGMHVLACLPKQADARSGRSSRMVLVLESSQGGTPVQMETADAEPDLLLSVILQRNEENLTEVFLLSGVFADLPEGLPMQVRNDLADLPSMVEEALAA
jgi:hypothetical protein